MKRLVKSFEAEQVPSGEDIPYSSCCLVPLEDSDFHPSCEKMGSRHNTTDASANDSHSVNREIRHFDPQSVWIL